jgi:hypothetical protein
MSSVLAICVIGMVGWTFAWQTGVWKPAPLEGGNGGVDMAPGAQVLGYISAICYLGLVNLDFTLLLVSSVVSEID